MLHTQSVIEILQGLLLSPNWTEKDDKSPIHMCVTKPIMFGLGVVTSMLPQFYYYDVI